MTKHLHTKSRWIARVGADPKINPEHASGGRTFRLFPHVEIGMRGDRPDQLTINAGGGPMAEHDANACLISAAPTMLAALENLENDDGRIPAHAWALVQAAIKEAYEGSLP